MSKNWILKAIRRPGTLHKAPGVPEDEPTKLGVLEKVAKGAGKLARRAWARPHPPQIPPLGHQPRNRV